MSQPPDPAADCIETLCDAIDEHIKNGGRMVFWTCPNGCRDDVKWYHKGGISVATCRKCGYGEQVTPDDRKEPNPAALIRYCPECGMVTVIDMDFSAEHYEAMRLPGQIVIAVTRERAQQAIPTAGACVCGNKE